MNRRTCLSPASLAPIAWAALALALVAAPAPARAQDAHPPASPSVPAAPSAPNAPGASSTPGHDAERAAGANPSPSAGSEGNAGAAPAVPPSAQDPEPSVDVLRTHDVVQRLVVAPNSSVRAGYAATIVHRPVGEIVTAIHDVDHYRDFVPQFEQSQELRRGTASQDLFVRITVAHVAHLWARLRYRDSAGPEGSVVIDGHALEGNVSRMDVRWRMTPIDGGASTVVEFWTLVLPAIAIPVPDSLLEGEQQSAARRGVVAVRRRVEPAAVAANDGQH